MQTSTKNLNVCHKALMYNYNINYANFINTATKEEPVFHKDKDAFDRKNGVCYVDKSGKEYTYDDLYSISFSDKAAAEIFDVLRGGSPEEDIERSWAFKKCPRCGHWIYEEENQSMFGRKDFVCHRCTPLRTNGKIKLWKDPYDDDRIFFKKRYAVFNTGITTLIGCNGIGKTTLIHNIKEELKKRGTPFLHFDHTGEEGGEKSVSSLFSQALEGKSIEGMDGLGYAATLWSSSEGERIKASFIRFINKTVSQIKEVLDYGEFWILFDALDSGLSLDVIEEIKHYVLKQISKELSDKIDLYIILSSNSYEMSYQTNGFSVEKMKYISIKTYESFRRAVLSSAVYKEKRDMVFKVKDRINRMPYEFTFDDNLAKLCDKYSKEACGQVAVMSLGKYRMVLEVKCKDDYEIRWKYRLYRTENGSEKEISCTDMNHTYDIRMEKDVIEEIMHDHLCKRVFSDENGKGG